MLFNWLHLPQAVVQVVQGLDGYALVYLCSRIIEIKLTGIGINLRVSNCSSLHVFGGHFGPADGQRVRFVLGENGHHTVLVGRGELAAWRSQAWTHDVGAAQHELDGALVHLLWLHNKRVFSKFGRKFR